MPYTAEQRRRKREEGRCYACLCRMAQDGKKTCRECRPKALANSLKHQQRLRARGVCTICARAEPECSDVCAGCYEKRRQRRMARSAAGACTARAKCKFPRLPHAAVCADHWFGIAARGCGLPSGEPLALMLKSLWKSQGGTCALTGMPLAIGDNASVDHILPTSRGGTNDMSNLRFVLRVANTMKSDRTDDELVQMCEAILATLRPQQTRRQG